MENVETSVKIKCLIDMALKGEISWQTLDFLFDGLTPTLNKSKQIINVLLKEFEKHQSICLIKRSNDDNDLSEDVIEIDEDQSTTELVDQRVTLEEGLNVMKSEDQISEDNKIDLSGQDRSENNYCGAESEDEKVINENNVLQILEQRKSSEDLMEIKYEDQTFAENDIDSTNVNEHEESELYSSKAVMEEDIIEAIRFIEDNSNTSTYDEDENVEIENSGNQVEENVEDHQDEEILNDDEKHEEKVTNVTQDQSQADMLESLESSKGNKGNSKETISYQCKICPKTFKRSNYLKSHERIHTKEEKFQCKICKKCFIHKNSLIAHEKIHSSEKPFQCNFCKFTFKDEISLAEHETMHTAENPYQCKYCKKKLINRSHQKMHELAHTGEKPFQCNFCEKSFNHPSNLKKQKKRFILVTNHTDVIHVVSLLSSKII